MRDVGFSWKIVEDCGRLDDAVTGIRIYKSDRPLSETNEGDSSMTSRLSIWGPWSKTQEVCLLSEWVKLSKHAHSFEQLQRTLLSLQYSSDDTGCTQ